MKITFFKNHLPTLKKRMAEVENNIAIYKAILAAPSSAKEKQNYAIAHKTTVNSINVKG